MSFEWPVYRAGRVAGVRALRLARGSTVVDLGCGTGLTLPWLREAVGDRGRAVGVDASAQMLRQADRRIRAAGWRNVELRQRDATRRLAVRPGDALGAPASADAAVFVYSLSLMTPWQRAWDEAVRLVRPGGRIAVVDMAAPTGGSRTLAPLARLACLVGGADIDAHPWTAVEHGLVDVTAVSLRGGHIQVRAGTVAVGLHD
jgi:demethylmenaquinone methyltransferase/2-methoxy-6-polyprenyl-1,4-benzoquinol methylase